MNEQLTFTVGIPTCYGGESLVATAKSLRASVNVPNFRFIIVADRTPITPAIKQQLTDLGVELYWNRVPGSFSKKVKKMTPMLTTEVFVLTEDDIIFEPKALSIILDAFTTDPDLTLVSTSILPLKPNSFFESLIAQMLYIVRSIGMNWNNSDNHLLASGRCMAFRTEALKQFKQRENIVNDDMYQYLENKRIGGKFKFLYDAKVYIRCPANMEDQIKASSKYQYSQYELQPYFKYDISKEYDIPFLAFVRGFGRQLFLHPVTSSLYLGVYIYTHTFRLSPAVATDPLLEVEMSTKNIS